MNEGQRKTLRAAAVIHEHLVQRGAVPDPGKLPAYSWENLLRLRRQMQRAQDRGWSCAAAVLVHDLNDELRRFQREVDIAVRAAEAATKPHRLPSPSEIVREILSLDEEFEGVEIDLAAHTLVVTTDRIVLEDISLGAFEIRLDWHRLDCAGQPYRVVALDPYPAARNEDVTHPHVQDGQLCEGEGKAAIAAALAEGRLHDFFLLVSQILHTYGRGNAYVELDRWGGIPCDDCGQSVDEDERYYCQRCDRTLCESCAVPCQGCRDGYCSACLHTCAACGWDHCSTCLTTCSGCCKRFCEGCRNGDQCLSCHEKQHQEESDDDLREDDCQHEDATLAAPDGWTPAFAAA